MKNSELDTIADIYVNIECTGGQTSNPYGICDGTPWSCRELIIITYRFVYGQI